MADFGKPLPLPSHIHYELLLQLLEQQTMATAYKTPHLRLQVQELIITLRKAMSQQRQLEETCKMAHFLGEMVGILVFCFDLFEIEDQES